jgi:hypothetical protein
VTYAGFVRPLLLALSIVPCACASLLGVEDGIPRDDASVDGAIVDSSFVPDVVVDGNKPDTARFSPLSCGTTTCNAASNEACCRTGTGDDAAAMTFKCVTSAAACDPATSVFIPCERGSNCASQDAGSVCCAFGSPATSVGCSPTCVDTGNTVVCDVADNDGGDCPVLEAGPLACLPSQATLVGFTICK